MSVTDALPDEVLTFGGSSRKYHRLVRVDGEPRPFCGQRGQNPLRKDRAVIESHYEPCANCFPEAASQEESQ